MGPPVANGKRPFIKMVNHPPHWITINCSNRQVSQDVRIALEDNNIKRIHKYEHFGVCDSGNGSGGGGGGVGQYLLRTGKI